MVVQFVCVTLGNLSSFIRVNSRMVLLAYGTVMIYQEAAVCELQYHHSSSGVGQSKSVCAET